jgi:cell division transport system permease protein
MALKVDYVVRETGTNLLRNITLTAASIITVAVSLALVGGTLLVRQGVSNATVQFKGGIEFIIFMNPDATADQTASMQESLDGSPEIKRFEYFNQQQAYEEFKTIFQDSPELIASVTPDILPPSFKVVPVNPDADVVAGLKEQYQTRPGVKEVVAATETIRTMQRLTGVLSTGIFIVAAVLLFAATTLVFNTIRTAMFARRREIEVMKLVGATNWFIRVPFMLEGLIQGLIGAAFAVGGVFIANHVFETRVANAKGFELLHSFIIDSSDVWTTSIFILAVACVIAVLGSGVAVTRFLDV